MPIVNAYVDGFNLYYRCLRETPYKWLDISKLCAALLPDSCTLNRIRYFTARVRALPHDPDAPTRQQVYLRALSTIPNLTIIYGHFLTNEVSMRLANPTPSGPKFARVIRTDEKGSDVNLASYLLLDVFKKECEEAFVISNDSDLVEPLNIVRREFGIRVGIALPAKGKPSVTLMKSATFVRRIRGGALAASQFNAILADSGGTFSKPPSW